MSSPSPNRIFYLDNLRVFTIALVVLHHFCIAYGGPGDWYYVEGKPDSIFAQLPLILFCSTNQAFFMGLLFLVSAYFISPSFNRKGSGTFLGDRLIRLGIPTLFCYFLFNPFTSWLGYVLFDSDKIEYGFGHALRHGWGRSFGAMWFVEVLIYFTLIYAGFRLLRKKEFKQLPEPKPFPSAGKILTFAVLLGLVTFILRIWIPVGWWMPGLNLQLAHFPQYIAMLFVGVIFWRNRWLESLTPGQGWKWFLFVNLFIFFGFPALFILGDAASGNLDPFSGGFYWQNLGYSIYEQIVGISLMVGLLGIFKGLLNRQNRLGKALSDSSYTVYIIHTIPLMIMVWTFQSWEFPLLAKFVILSLPALALSFLMAWLIRSIPGFSRVL